MVSVAVKMHLLINLNQIQVPYNFDDTKL